MYPGIEMGYSFGYIYCNIRRERRFAEHALPNDVSLKLVIRKSREAQSEARERHRRYEGLIQNQVDFDEESS
jgi:hypothetical protein